MKSRTLQVIVFVIAGIAVACGKVSGNEDKNSTSNTSGIQNVDSAGASPAGAPPAYVSSQTISSTQFTVSLTKECTDATGLNKSNFLLSNGLQVTSISKKAGDPTTLVINTTIQQPITYTLTMLNLIGTNGAALVGVIQVNFTGLPSPAITSIDWKKPTDGSALPTNVGAITFCSMTSGAGSSCTAAPFYAQNGLYGDNIQGAYAVAYKYKIDAGSWSAEIPKGTPLQTGSLADGYHTLYVIGKHTNGYWQDTAASDVFVKSFVQDTAAPSASLDTLTLPSLVTASLSLNVGVVGTDVSYFTYCLDNGTITDCTDGNYKGGPDLASGGLQIPNGVYTANLVAGSVTIKVIGYDRSGNTLSSPISGGTYTYTVDTGAVEAVFLLSDLTSITPTQTSVSIHVLGSNGAALYKGKIVDGTDCNAGTGWDMLPEVSLSTPITATGLTDAIPQKTVCAIGKSVSGCYWQGGWAGNGCPGPFAPTATASIITKYTWTVDTTPPTASINWINPVTKPSTTTQTTGYQMQISSVGAAVNYKFALLPVDGSTCATATYRASTDVNTAITLGAGDIATTGVNTYTLCAIGQDAAGNWQSATSAATTGTWTVDVDPPANNPSFTAASSSPAQFNNGVLTFNIDNTSATADSYYYRIQVAKDSGFSTIISDTIVHSCKTIDLPDCPAALTTKAFAVAVDPFANPSAYARVQAGDSYGNYRSDYSATSAEHYVVGKLAGTIKDQSNTPLSGIAIRIYTTGGTNVTSLYGGSIATDATGSFTIDNVRTAKLGYEIRAAVGDATYYPATKRNITIQPKGTLGTLQTNIGTLNLAKIAGSSAQTVSAKVVDGDDGWMLGYGNVSLIDYQGTVVATQRGIYSTCTGVAPVGSPPTNVPREILTSSATCGDVSFASVNPGTYTLQVDGNSWGTSGNQQYNRLDVENVTVFASAVDKGRIPLVRLLSGQDLKVILSWGTLNPQDFDLHVVGTVPSGQTMTNISTKDNCNTTQFHAWAGRPNIGYGAWQEQYSAKSRTYIQGNAGYNGQNYFPLDPSTTVALVQDANQGYGPEAVNFLSGYTDGTYWFTVVNWSEWKYTSYGGGANAANQAWDTTNVNLKVYDADGLAFEMIAAQPQATDIPTNPHGADTTCDSVAEWGHCELWQAFKLTVSGSGSAGRVYTPVNTYQGWPGSENGDNSYSWGTNSWDADKCSLSAF